MYHFFRKYFFSILVSAIILFLSTALPPSFPKPDGIKHLDKIVHFCMYAGLAVVLSLEISKRKSYGYYFFTILFPILYGGLIEIIQQYFFPPRTGDIFDFFANVAGVMAGYFAAIGLLRIKKVKHWISKR